MKKILLMAMIAALAVGSAACSTSDTKSSSSVELSANSSSAESSESSESQAEKVIYDENNIKITFTGTEKKLVTTAIQLKIENSSDKDIVVQAEDLSINDCMMTTLFSSTVKKGKTANDGLEVGNTDLEDNKIDKIKTAEFKLQFSDPETFQSVFDDKEVKIEIE